MGEAKRRAGAFAGIKDEHWRTCLRDAYDLVQQIPQPLRLAWGDAMDSFLASAEQQQVSPQQIAALIATTFGALCLAETNGNAMNDAVADRFVELCHAAIHIGVAAARIEAGWTPGGKH